MAVPETELRAGLVEGGTAFRHPRENAREARAVRSGVAVDENRLAQTFEVIDEAHEIGT